MNTRVFYGSCENCRARALVIEDEYEQDVWQCYEVRCTACDHHYTARELSESEEMRMEYEESE